MSLEAEQSILGALLLLEGKGHTANKAMDMLKPTYFEHPLNRSIFETMRAMDDYDLITLDARMTNHPVYKDLNGFSYLVDLGKNTPSSSNIMNYVKVVRDRAVERFAIRKLNEALATLTDDSEGDIYQRLGLAESLLAEVNQKGMGSDKGLRHIKEFGKIWNENLEKYHSGDKDAMGITTGITTLDAQLRPKLIPKGSLVVVGARPKMGKSAFLSLLVNHSAIDLQKRTAVFSMEMPGDQIFERALTTDGKVNPVSYYNETTGPVYDTLVQTSGKLVNSHLYVDDTPGMTLAHIQREARNLARQGDLGCIAVDYLTLMATEKAERNDLAYGHITKSLKNLAKELNCYVLLLTQLNRSLESRTDKRPMPSDSRDTGQIEQDCDLWIGLYRHSVYHECQHKGLTEAIIRLNRHGQTGTVYLDLREGYFVPLSDSDGEMMKVQNEGQEDSRGGFSL